MDQQNSNDLWRDKIRPGIEQELIDRGVNGASREAILSLLPTNTPDWVVDFSGWLNGIILGAAGNTPFIGVAVNTGTRVLASVSLDLASYDEGEPRDGVLETILAETTGGAVSFLTSLAIDAAAAGTALAIPEFSMEAVALAAEGATLGLFLGNGAVALLHEGWDHVFGTEYTAAGVFNE